MQTDFHFYAVYALARAAGFKADDADVIAYSSEHTDDAKYDHALDFQNGGRFQQILTAHQFLTPRALNRTTCYRIWVPFHFLPGNLGVDFYERMVTRPGGAIAQRLIDDLLASNIRPYALHRLGILLHCYADTWSHQNFLGVIRDNMNSVRKLKVQRMPASSFQNVMRSLRKRVKEYAIPKLGHAQAGTIPDEPYREWRYENYSGKKFDIYNVERSLDAAQSCYQVMLKFLKIFPAYSHTKPLQWHELTSMFEKQLGLEADSRTRVDSWKDAISGGEFGLKIEENDKNINYDDREWFRYAVKVEKTDNGKEIYERKPEFEKSNWKFFHDAGAFHRFTVLHEILPEHGMICG